MRKYFAVFAAALLLVSSVQAASLEAGFAAYQHGDYATALREFQPLAQQGDAKAQFSLGWMYYQGEGVAQDLRKARQLFEQAVRGDNAEARQAALEGLRQLNAMGK